MGLMDRTRRAGPLLACLVALALTTACGVARVGNATIGEVGVAGSLTGQAGSLVGEGSAVDHDTGAELGGVKVWINFPAVITSGMRWVAEQAPFLFGPETPPNPDVGTLVPIRGAPQEQAETS